MSEKIIQKGKKFINMDTQIQITGFIKVKTWDMIIQVWGSGLKVSDFNSNGIYIFGNIQSVELIKNG